MKIPIGINNTKVIEKTRKYGKITEWEAKHTCICDNWETINLTEVKTGIPIRCLICSKDIVKFVEEDDLE